MRIDLNADLAEGAGFDAELMPLISSANVCCGAHAGGPAEMAATLELARLRDVAIGAHPGYADRANFGRADLDLSSREIADLVLSQVAALQSVAERIGLKVKYVKPHGALYNRACRDRGIADSIVEAIVELALPVVGLPGSQLELACRNRLPFAAEGFADRRYRDDGSLVPRSEPDAFIHDPEEAVLQVERLIRDEGIRTVCIHGDNPEAVSFAVAVRRSLIARGIQIERFSR